MKKENCTRSACKDVFHAFLVSNAEYAGAFEIPTLQPTYQIPNRVIAFSKAIKSKDYDQWVHFFEDDYLFERIWNNPKKYLPILRRFKGVILPDFSVYRDMPLIMQIWNIYRSRALGHWLQKNGICIIANIRYGDERTYQAACDGVPESSIIAIGTHGTLKNPEDRKYLLEGLDFIINRLNPTDLVIYGAAPDKYFSKYRERGIRIHQFDSEFAIVHQKEKD